MCWVCTSNLLLRIFLHKFKYFQWGWALPGSIWTLIYYLGIEEAGLLAHFRAMGEAREATIGNTVTTTVPYSQDSKTSDLQL